MKLAIAAIAAMSLLIAVPAGAVVVTVTPSGAQTPTGVNTVVENQLTNGWSIVTNRFGIGELLPGGPSLAEADNGLNSLPSGTGIDFGRGTFYAACSHVGQGSGEGEDQTPSTIFLGLDQFGSRPGGLAGITLNQIKTLKYYTYVSKNPSRQQDGSSPNNWDSARSGWLFPSQPIMLQLTVEHPNAPLSTLYTRQQFTLRPWVDTNIPVRGDPKYEDGLGAWLEITIIENGVVPPNSPRWMWHWTSANQPDVVDVGNWTSLCNMGFSPFGYSTTFGQCRLLPTSTSFDEANYKISEGYKSCGWRDTTRPIGWQNTTGTGKPLNFVLGARRSVLKWPTQSTATNWARFESINARAQMDYFTLGIDLNNDGDDLDAGEKFTYNFEPAATDQRPTIAYMSQKDAKRSAPRTDRILTNRQPIRLFDNLFKVAGRVTATGNLDYCPWFELDDGSAINPKVRVYYFPRLDSSYPYPPFPPGVNEFWEAWGFLELPRWPYTVGEPTITLPQVLWSTPGNCRKLR